MFNLHKSLRGESSSIQCSIVLRLALNRWKNSPHWVPQLARNAILDTVAEPFHATSNHGNLKKITLFARFKNILFTENNCK